MNFALSHGMHDRMMLELREQLVGAELRLFDQVAPTSPNAPIIGQKHLATCAFETAEFADGMVRASLQQDLAIASGAVAWARAFNKDGEPIFDCDVGEIGSGACIELNTLGIRKGGPVLIRSFVAGIRR